MADEELAALRQQRLAELQAKHGVRRGARHTAAPCGRGSGAGRGGAARPPRESGRRLEVRLLGGGPELR